MLCLHSRWRGDILAGRFVLLTASRWMFGAGEGNLLVRRPQPLEELSASGGRDKHDTGAVCEDEILGLGYMEMSSAQ